MEQKQSEKQGNNLPTPQFEGDLDYQLLFNVIAKNASEQTLLLDTGGRLLFINAATAKSFNRKPEDFLGMHFSEFLNQEDAEAIKNYLQQVISDQKTHRLNISATILGEKRSYQVTSQPIRNSAGQVFAILVLANDVTQELQTKKALAGAHAFQRNLIDNLQEAILIIDDNGKPIDVNPAAIKMFGFSQEDFLADDDRLFSILPNERIMFNVMDSIKNQGFAQGELNLKRKDGEDFIFSFYAIANTSPGQHFVVGRDITREKEIEQELIESEKRYRALFETAQEAILIVNNDFECIDVNPYLLTMSGYQKVEFLQLRLGELFPDLNFPQLETLEQSSQGVDIYQGEHQLVRRDSKVLEIDLTFIKNYLPDMHLLLIQDITERKQAEKALRDSELRYRSLFNSAADAIFIMEGNTFIDCNPTTVKMFGCTDKSEILNRSPWEFSPQYQPDGSLSQEKAAQLIQKALNGVPQNFVWRHTKFDGTLFDAEVSLNCISIKGKNYLQALVRDITERKKAEEALQESEARYSSLVNVSPNAIFIIQDKKYVFANPAAAKILGYDDPYQVLNMEVEKTISLPYREIAKDRILQTLAGKKNEFAVIEIQQPDGTTRQIESFSIPYKYNDRPASLVIGMDVTDRLVQENILSTFYRAAPLGIGIVIGRQIIQANEMFCQMTGYELHELLDQDSRMLYFNDEDYEKVGFQKDNQMNKFGVATTESRIRRKDGSSMDVLISSIPFDKDDWSKGINTVVLDISERKQAERLLQNMNIELEERVKVRTQQLEKKTVELESFSYSVSHDLRAPLRAINGLSQILLEEYAQNWENAPKELLKNIITASQKMDQQIDGLLTLSRLGQKHLNFTKTDIGKLADRVFHELADQITDRKITFRVNDTHDVYADHQLLEIALTNLISNAIKFTQPRQHARIDFGAIQQDGDTVYYLEDNGIGFDQKYADKLFTPFQRLESSEEFEGTGIGLTIVKRIVERHQGDIWVKSAKGEGTTFFFTLKMPSSTEVQ
ncbi:MAG: PAS domain S-box protein [Anaerolineales bacterium]